MTVAVNTSGLAPSEAERYLAELEDGLSLPCVDPLTTGVAVLVDRLA